MNRRRMLVLVVLASVAVVLAMGDLLAQSKPGAAQVVPAITRVAVCDMVKIYSNYQKAKDLRVKVEEGRRNFKSEDELRGKKIESLNAELKELKVGSKEYDARVSELAKLTIERETLQKFEDNRNVREYYRMSEDIYSELQKAAADVAKENGVQLVLNSDDTSPSDDKPDLFARMERKKVLYSDPAMDITDAIVARMNQQYKTEKK
jgi:Skp family chaperone for outer membrane proteins